jgi:hypothetical protein
MLKAVAVSEIKNMACIDDTYEAMKAIAGLDWLIYHHDDDWAICEPNGDYGHDIMSGWQNERLMLVCGQCDNALFSSPNFSIVIWTPNLAKTGKMITSLRHTPIRFR